MGHIVPRRFTYIVPTLLVLLTGCNQSTAPDITSQAAATAVETAAQPLQTETAPAAAADTCASNAQVAVDFVNLYIRHLKDKEMAANPPETYDWLKSNSLVDASVASAYATFDSIDGDPILDAQDYPDTFVSAGCPGAPDAVLLQGVGMDMKVPVKVAKVAGKTKVVGVGRINMLDVEAQSETSAAPAEACLDAWIAAHRSEVGEDAVVTMDQVGEWEQWCAAGKKP